ncbi:MAG: DUF4430 domain-containing protein [Thermoleophilaceae bacterium]
MARAASLLLACLALAGCGLGPGKERSGGAELRVTRDFGQRQLGSASARKVREGQTVMRLLRSHFDVDTRYGGRFVQAIRGVTGKGQSGRRDWFFFVNGSEAPVGAAEYELSPGDVVQWDYRRWDVAMRVPAIVGAFPEPFRHGLRGKRRPVRVECENASAAPCKEAKARLRGRGIEAAGSSLGTSGTRKVIRVVVAKWPRARTVSGAALLEREPSRSGVFARFTNGGLQLLSEDGRLARVAAPGTGLVAALAPSQDELVWLVTARDDRGLLAAARALDARDLRNAYAVAATSARSEKLPLAGPSR